MEYTTRSKSLLEESISPLFSIRIKDMMLGELMCHAGLITDREFLDLLCQARKIKVSLGVVLTALGYVTSSQLFVARRILNRYLNDADRADCYIDELRAVVGTPRFASRKRSKVVSRMRTA